MVSQFTNNISSPIYSLSTAITGLPSNKAFAIVAGIFLGTTLAVNAWKSSRSVTLPSQDKPVRRHVQHSKEEGDLPTHHDTMFNFIPAACLETAISIRVLENPGLAGQKIDEAASRMASRLEYCYGPASQSLVQDSKGETTTLKEALDREILHELRPTGNQIGRCLSYLGNDWLGKDGTEWVIAQLRAPTRSESAHLGMLTKIRAISALGKFVYDHYQNNQVLIATILSISEKDLSEKYHSVITCVRHSDFSTPATRGRSERAPIIDGVSITSLVPKPERVDGPTYGASTGKIYIENNFAEVHKDVSNRFKQMKKELSAEGIPRQFQVITDYNRPGILSDLAVQRMPTPFKEAQLPALLKKFEMYHGNGINRWMHQGRYIRESLHADLPIAGAQSGSVADILLGLDCLNSDRVYGNPEFTESVGVLISAWMAFGGYHSFIETFPIAQAVSLNQRFETSVKKSSKVFYKQFIGVVQKQTNAGKLIMPFIKAYKESL